MVRVAGNRDTTPGSCEPGGAAEPHRVFYARRDSFCAGIAGVGSLIKAPLREPGDAARHSPRLIAFFLAPAACPRWLALPPRIHVQPL